MTPVPFFSFAAMNEDLGTAPFDVFRRFWDRQWYILGESVTAFETEYARWNGTKHCIGVANGLDALHLALRALNVGPGDEVIVPSNTYIATWLAVSQVGATIVPVEPHPATCNLDPARIEAAITPATKVILPVHLYGQACDMTQIMAVAEKHRLYVVEDNAQAHGALHAGKMTGSFGHLNATSFYPTKNLGALGDAGALTTGDAALAAQVKLLRNYGSSRKYYNETPGYNSRLDELQAALLSMKLPFLAQWTAQRRHLARLYQSQLIDLEEITLPTTSDPAAHVWHQFVVRTTSRDALAAHLTAQGIGWMIHYPVPPHLQQAYLSLGYRRGDFPLAEKMAGTSLSLPFFPGMAEQQVEQVTTVIRQFFRQT
ncbi:MAG TPA: DegT/DnrJ/EryC1/StrS family aminotransferase [Saprospiraceae bacterium]|nr:DegT/DnrJ/EryC1/StrS family aminotransferase [Saprospiraceae bacterium]